MLPVWKRHQRTVPAEVGPLGLSGSRQTRGWHTRPMGRSQRGVRMRWVGALRRSAALAVSLVLAIGAMSPTVAASGIIRQPVVFVHGHSPAGRGTCHASNALARQMRSADAGHAAYRFTGEIVPVGFYGGDTRASGDDWGDTGCRWWAHLSNYGEHGRATPSGHRKVRGVIGHTTGTSIRHLAYHLAWFIHDRYSRQGVSIDVVGQSMGGLIIRYAVAAAAARAPGFPRRLLVDDVATLGTPLGGHEAELFTSLNRETREMDKDSALMAWLHAHALAPPRAGQRTDWTFIGSYADGLIPTPSTIGRRCGSDGSCEPWLRAQHYVVYDTRPTDDGPLGVTHSEYDHTTGYDPVYRARVWRDGAWSWTDALVPPVRLIEWALARDDW